MATYTVWTSFADPKTLMPVGTDAICTLCNNIICFLDVKTHEITYYKAESPTLGLSISACTGHNRIPIVAFAEVVLRPSVHIIQYPKLNKYATFKTNDIVGIVDIRFNEYDLLIAISGVPNYTFIIWNFRSGQQLMQQDSHKEAMYNSLLLSSHYTPQIIQYSERHRNFMVWEICDNEAGQVLHRTSRINLDKEYRNCNAFSMCFSEDNNLYIVDDFGAVSLVQTSQFFLIPVWSSTDTRQSLNIRLAKKHYLYSHNKGLLVNNLEYIYFIRSKNNTWDTEWKLYDLPSGGFYRLISNGLNDIYGAVECGNIYQVEPQDDTVTLKEIYSFNVNAKDVVLLKHIKDECLVLLTRASTLRACDMVKRKVFSECSIACSNATAIAANNTSSYIIVGTSTGSLHYFDFGDTSNPKEIEQTQTENGFTIAFILYYDFTVVYRDVFYNYFMAYADFPRHKFYDVAPIVTIPDDLNALYSALADEKTLFIFVGGEAEGQLPHATHLWTFSYNSQKEQFTRREYKLPHIYRDFTIMKLNIGEDVEFVGARENSTLLDVYHITKSSFILTSTLQTAHLAYISGIVGTRSVLSWSVDGSIINYRAHKKSPKPFAMSQVAQIKYKPQIVEKVMDCFNLKYLVFFYSHGGIKVFKISIGGMSIVENTFLSLENQVTTVKPLLVQTIKIIKSKPTEETIEHTPAELEAKDKLLKRIQQFSKSISSLINYDIEVTGKKRGIYRKFCLNQLWLETLTREAKKLCTAEAASLEAATTDQRRVRDWLRNLITSGSMSITYKIRAIFANFSFENYGKRNLKNKFTALYDAYALYDFEYEEEVEEASADEDSQYTEDDAGDSEKLKSLERPRKLFNVRGSVFDHLISDELALQDVHNVTANQMCNFDAKIRLVLTDPLKEEFNRKFDEIRQIKFDLMNAILSTNSQLENIYDNMNIMLRLLHLNAFNPPELSVPLWQKDEFVHRIMEVDDSEIKAINRRKKKAEVTAVKHGRLLLWSVDFWVRSLIVMMDGVLEKLWEEEIKKDIPIPEFMLKKESTEYSLEEQKIVKDYEEKVRILIADRRKYLKILGDNDDRITEMKMKYISKLNQHVAEMMIIKLKYDYCIKHIRLRNLNIKIMHYYRNQGLKNMKLYRRDIKKIGDYSLRYSQLADSWGNSLEQLRSKGDNLVLRERAIERQFKNHYINQIPQSLASDMLKAFKKRPKIPPKLFNSILMCRELSVRVNTRTGTKYNFPMPKEANDYLDALTAMDEPNLMPVSMEPRHWEVFTRSRRQKIELELKIKATNLHIADTMTAIVYFNKEAQSLKQARGDTIKLMYDAEALYLKALYDQTLECRLTMGQVELNFSGSLSKLENCVLMHEDDIMDINELILRAGQSKLKSMHRVAYFRRQVIFREWEHKVVTANIEYLKFMLHIIEKCKVTMEFLTIIRNWDKLRSNKQKMLNTVGLLERLIEEKQLSYRRQLERFNGKITAVRQQIDQIKQSHKVVNEQITDLKVEVAFCNTSRDYMVEDKRHREKNEMMEKLKKHSKLMDTVRRDYAHIMELRTILELQRLRTYPTLGPNPDTCLNKLVYMPN